MIKGLLDKITSNGDKGAVVPFSRIEDIKSDMIVLKNGDFHTDWINRMVKHTTDNANKFIPSNIDFEPHSLISVVMRVRKVVVRFHYRSKPIDCTASAGNVVFYSNNDRVLRYINEYLSPLGFSAVTAITVPQKILAVHCGIARYGRNNICYNDEFGSDMQIMTYISDLPCDESAWFPLRRMDICEKCSACVTACPTGAIDPSRRLIDSDRCITYYNESPGEFPDWLDSNVHNSIVGCSKCQDCCPANSKNKDNVRTGVVFTEDETTELLNLKGDMPYTDSLAAKIEATGIMPEFTKPDILSRNLAVLLKNAID